MTTPITLPYLQQMTKRMNTAFGTGSGVSSNGVLGEIDKNINTLVNKLDTIIVNQQKEIKYLKETIDRLNEQNSNIINQYMEFYKQKDQEIKNINNSLINTLNIKWYYINNNYIKITATDLEMFCYISYNYINDNNNFTTNTNVYIIHPIKFIEMNYDKYKTRYIKLNKNTTNNYKYYNYLKIEFYEDLTDNTYIDEDNLLTEDFISCQLKSKISLVSDLDIELESIIFNKSFEISEITNNYDKKYVILNTIKNHLNISNNFKLYQVNSLKPVIISDNALEFSISNLNYELQNLLYLKEEEINKTILNLNN